eukprot:s314_g36.t3
MDRLEDAEDERPTWQRAEDANGEGRRQFPAVFSNVDSLRQAFLCISGLVAAAEHDQIDIERPKIPAWPEDVRQQTVRDESPRRMPNCPPIAAADSVREGRPSGQLWRRICAISLCTGMLAALCFVCGSLLGSAMGGSRWSPELMDFTNFIGILVLFVGMAGAGCDAFSQALKYRVWASVPFSSLQLGVAPPAFQTYLVQGNGHFASEVILSESVSCTCCLSEFDGADTVAVLPQQNSVGTSSVSLASQPGHPHVRYSRASVASAETCACSAPSSSRFRSRFHSGTSSGASSGAGSGVW